MIDHDTDAQRRAAGDSFSADSLLQLPSYRDGSEGLHVANGDLVIRGFHEAGEANSFDTEEQLQRPIEGEGQEQR